MKQMKPMEIENESFRIITEELKNYDTSGFSQEELLVLKRVIHTTADFSYVKDLCFSANVITEAFSLLKKQAHIVTDTTMARSGINKKAIEQLSCETHCFIGDELVANEAQQRGVTRSLVAVERAKEFSPLIYVVGNAPTALLGLHEQIKNGNIAPQLIIAAPVGFVNVVESKELILQGTIPFIAVRGRKGGSNVAAAIVNALLYQLTRESNS